ncbi:hypothetical protein [Caryophanon latum]|uniref:Uncharacterized protein n=1 Tax=Caryophanon latum TaxID=33977 RepID=A0A1C0YX79_9BACL|nr:hypothetical protein [Caryophanon latum]OCS91761.1 hypothetical protein A6K76_01210 [Caryophanon latum]
MSNLENKDLEGLAKEWKVIDSSLNNHKKLVLGYSVQTVDPDPIFVGMSKKEVNDYFEYLCDENDKSTAFNSIAAMEALFFLDFKTRTRKKLKDPLSRKMRENITSLKPSLEKEILKIWKEHHPEFKSKINKFSGLLTYRHWFAHGRHWPLDLKHRVDLHTVFKLCRELVEELPLKRM